MAKGEELFAAMQAARDAFLPHLEPNTPAFWVNLLDQQVIEAKLHREEGNLDKVANEIADLFCVGYQALLDLGKDPEPFIVQRIRGHIIPKAAYFAERDRAGNGYKPTTQAPHEQAPIGAKPLVKDSTHPCDIDDCPNLARWTDGLHQWCGWPDCGGQQVA